MTKHYILKNKALHEIEEPKEKGLFRFKINGDAGEAFLYFKKIPQWEKVLLALKGHFGIFPSDFDKQRKLVKENMRLLTENGYKIRYNPLFKEFQTSHDNIGVCESFKFFDEAELYCLKG